MRKQYYINSLPYEIELTARLCHENAKRILESYTKEISIEEFSLLDTIIVKPNSSQADLSRLILKGKAHTGRFLMSLEEKGLIARKIEERNGKLIKIAQITNKGKNLYENIMNNVAPSIEKFNKVITSEDAAHIVSNLRKLRASIEKVSKIVFD